MDDHTNSSISSEVDDRNPFRRPGRRKASLWVYVVGVIIVLAIINWLAMSQTILIFSGGFLIGMLAMYIAVHIYKVK